MTAYTRKYGHKFMSGTTVKCTAYRDPWNLQSLVAFNYIYNTTCLLYGRPLPIKVVESGFSCTPSVNSIPAWCSASTRSVAQLASSSEREIIGCFITNNIQNSQKVLETYYDGTSIVQVLMQVCLRGLQN